MLSDQEQTSVRSAISGVASRAGQVLQQAADAGQAVAVVRSLHSGIDSVVSAWTAGDPAPMCKPGCCFCCSARVEVTDPEALHLAQHVQGLPAARRQALALALAQQLQQRAQAGPGARVPCAFLEQDLCSVYHHRPAACRKAHSLALEACAQHQPQVPQNLVVALRCEVLMEGTRQAYLSSGLPAGKHELSAAVLAALGAADAAGAWHAGTPLLASQPAAGLL